MICLRAFIEQLQELERQFGDVPVLSREDGMGGYAMSFATAPHATTLDSEEHLEEAHEYIYNELAAAAHHVDDWGGFEVTAVAIGSGSRLYST